MTDPGTGFALRTSSLYSRKIVIMETDTTGSKIVYNKEGKFSVKVSYDMNGETDLYIMTGTIEVKEKDSSGNPTEIAMSFDDVLIPIDISVPFVPKPYHYVDLPKDDDKKEEDDTIKDDNVTEDDSIKDDNDKGDDSLTDGEDDDYDNEDDTLKPDNIQDITYDDKDMVDGDSNDNNEKDKSNTKKNKGVKTFDEYNIMYWIAMSIVSLVTLVIMATIGIVSRRKRQRGLGKV